MDEQTSPEYMEERYALYVLTSGDVVIFRSYELIALLIIQHFDRAGNSNLNSVASGAFILKLLYNIIFCVNMYMLFLFISYENNFYILYKYLSKVIKFLFFIVSFFCFIYFYFISIFMYLIYL